MKKRQVAVKKEGSSSSTSSSAVRSVRYGECQRNHAANIGGYAVDGCREFMASGVEGTDDALTCAACGCHRNFHRREVETEVMDTTDVLSEFFMFETFWEGKNRFPGQMDEVHSIVLARGQCIQRSTVLETMIQKAA